MSTTNDVPTSIHHGRNIKRFREMMGLKQEALAIELGDDWTQRKVSLLETKEAVEKDLLQQIATILKLPVEAFENFDENTPVLNIQNNYEGSNTSASHVFSNNINCTFNPLDKYLEATERIEKLYEALLASEREKIALLQQMLDMKSK